MDSANRILYTKMQRGFELISFVLLVAFFICKIATYPFLGFICGFIFAAVFPKTEQMKIFAKIDDTVPLPREDGSEPEDDYEEEEYEDDSEEEDDLDEEEYEEEEEESEDQDTTDAAAFRAEIEDLKKRLQEANETNSELKKEKKQVEEELKQVKNEFKTSQMDLEFELQEIVHDLMRQEERKKAEFEEAVEEAKFDRLEEVDADTSFEFVDDVQE